MTGGSRLHFADRLAALVEERRSRVVLGLDPDPAALWPRVAPGRGRATPRLARVHTAGAVAEHCRAAIVAAGPACVAVKLAARLLRAARALPAGRRSSEPWRSRATTACS